MADLAELRARLATLDDGPADAPERLDVMAALGWQLRFGAPKEGEAFAEQAHRLATQCGYLPARAQAGRSLLMYMRWRHDLADAVVVAQQALSDFRELGDLDSCAAVLDGLSTILEELGDPADVPRHDRRPARERLDDRHRRTLVVRRQQERVHDRIQPGQVAAPAEPHHAVANP